MLDFYGNNKLDDSYCRRKENKKERKKEADLKKGEKKNRGRLVKFNGNKNTVNILQEQKTQTIVN